MSHYLTFVPLRRVEGHLVEVEVACWLDSTWTVVAMECACGYRHRLVDATDLGVDLSRFYGEISLSDETLERLTAELDCSPHAAEMVPAFQDLREPSTEPPVPVPA
jgi:hypothetical protein